MENNATNAGEPESARAALGGSATTSSLFLSLILYEDECNAQDGQQYPHVPQNNPSEYSS
jgi:hypothetical protein